MADIAFLLGDVELARHDHHLRLPAAFRAAGWQVTSLPQDGIRLEPGGVTIAGTDPGAFDLLWPLGMGRQETFLDRMQLLRLVPPERLVTPVDALVYWHAKYPWWRHMPETYAGADVAWLLGQVNDGEDWVVKPPAGSFGRDVVRVRGPDQARTALERATAGGRRFCLLQRYAAQAADGEKRSLVAGGRIVGSYLRRGADFRANLSVGGTASATELNSAERRLVTGLAADLAGRGIGFAAVDIAYPYLIEINLANPGGLGTLHDLYGTDPSGDVVAAVSAWWQAGRRANRAS